MKPAIVFLAQEYEQELIRHYEEYFEGGSKLKLLQPFVWVLFYLNKSSSLEKWFGLKWEKGFTTYMVVRFIQTLLDVLKRKNDVIDTMYRSSCILDFAFLCSSFAGLTSALSTAEICLKRTLDFPGYAVGMVVNNSQIVSEHYYTLITVVVPILYWIKDIVRKFTRPNRLTMGCKYCGRQDINMPLDGSCYVCTQLN